MKKKVPVKTRSKLPTRGVRKFNQKPHSKARTPHWKKRRRAATKMVNDISPTHSEDLSKRTPSEILAMKFAKDDLFLGDGIIGKGKMFVLLGPAGVGQSRLTFQLAASLILGTPFMQLAVNCSRKRVLIVQTENVNRRLHDDLSKMKRSWSEEEWRLIDQHLVFHTLERDGDDMLQLHAHENAAAVARLIKDVRPDVVIFDPLNAFAIGSLNTDAGMQKTCNELRRLAKLGNPTAAIGIVHHTRTGKEGLAKVMGPERASYGRGSKALHACARGVFNIAQPDPMDYSKILVACGKNSDGPEFVPFCAKLNVKTHLYEVAPMFELEVLQETKGRVTLTSTDVARYVRDLPLKKKNLVTMIMDDIGCEKSTAYAAIKAAIGKTVTLNPKKEITAIPPK